jgi:tRNA1Val (adenine37-N6)-methyltransferase
MEPKRMRMVHPFVNKEPNMVLIEAVRGGKSMIKVEPPMIVYKKPGIYTDEIYSIYGMESQEIITGSKNSGRE